MHQSSSNGAYNLLSLASQILDTAKESCRIRSVAPDIKEVWDILLMLGVRPSAIGWTAADIRQMLITGHYAEALRLFLNPPPATASADEKKRAFKAMLDNILAAMRQPPPPPPSLAAPPVSNEVVHAVISMNDPFVNMPKGCVPFTGAIPVEEFEDDGEEPMEVSDADIHATDYLEESVNEAENGPLTLASPRDQAIVERFFGGKDGAREFGFVRAPKSGAHTPEALMAELGSVSPPQPSQVTSSEETIEGPMPLSGPRMMSEPAPGYAS